jgi:hypothetical protein
VVDGPKVDEVGRLLDGGESAENCLLELSPPVPSQEAKCWSQGVV